MTGYGRQPGYEERLRAFTGRELRPPTPAQDPVNQPMIRHWAEAMGDTNPVYTDVEAARATGRAGVVAPASMVQAWTMRGYAATAAPQPGGRVVSTSSSPSSTRAATPPWWPPTPSSRSCGS